MCGAGRNRGPRHAGIALLLLASLLGAGCAGMAGAPGAVEPVAVPDTWNESPGNFRLATAPTDEELATWWRQLEDPVLDELVERTIQGNVDLEVAATRVKEARARRGLARSALGPSVSASLTQGRSEPLGEQVVASSISTASLEVAWEADVFGSNRASLAASQADLEAETENLRAVRVALVAETVVAYADLRVAEASLAVLDESLSSREETFRLTSWREQAGLASRLEANQARSSLDQARAARPALQQEAVDARLRLVLLAGEPPGALDELLTVSGPKAGIPAPPGALSVGIPADALRQRPDVRSAERRVEAAWARLEAAEADRYPTLRFTGSLDSRSEGLSDLFDVDSAFANFLAGLAAPIFESGRIRENIALNEAQWEQAALAYRGAVLEALSEVELALASFRFSQERIAALEAAVISAAEAAELAEQRYAAGLVDLLSVLDTQRTLLSIEDQLITARGGLLSSFSGLYRALGGGWSAASP